MGGRDGFIEFLRVLRHLSHAYGPISHFQLFTRHFYFLDDPAAIEELLVTKGRDFVKSRGAESLKRLLGEGLLTSEDPPHLRQRRLVQPAFHRERIAGYAATMVTEAERCGDDLIDRSSIDMMRTMMRLTLGIAAKTLFGSDVGVEADEIYEALTTTTRLVPDGLGPFAAFRQALPLPANFRFRRARERLDRTIFAMIAQRRNAPEDRGDLLSTLLLARNEDGEGMSDTQLRDEALTIFLAGHETTALTLTWSWFLLAGDPERQARLHDELAAFGERALTIDDLGALAYTAAVVREALRLYPPAWLLGRRAIRDVTIGGYAIAKGSVVFTSPYVTHRNPRLFPEPLAFRPERWLNDDERAKFAYFPFGGGSRVCIGESFAWTEATLALATLARRWSFTLAPSTKVELYPMVTIRPKHPMVMRAHRRRPAPGGVRPC
jgi:cytochrome P450